MGRFTLVRVTSALALFLCACTPRPAAQTRILHARFDPEARVIPMPSDVLRDAEAGHLALPADAAGLSDAEKKLYEYLNTRDAWSSASQATAAFTGAIDPATIDASTVQVFQWSAGVPALRADRVPALDGDGLTLRVDAPDAGWDRGGRYSIAIRGGEHGVKGAAGEKVECDAAFYFLRLKTPLTDPAHVNAFPGETIAEKQANAAKLEKIRLQLAPLFDDLETRGIPRNEVAALWTFSVTQSTELAMDKISQRVPLPSDLMIDPATSHIDIPDRASDSELEHEVKATLRAYEGFGPTMTPSFEFTAPVDPATVHASLFKAGATTPLEATTAVSTDHLRIRLTAKAQIGRAHV